jgi:hypothetical protein
MKKLLTVLFISSLIMLTHDAKAVEGADIYSRVEIKLPTDRTTLQVSEICTRPLQVEIKITDIEDLDLPKSTNIETIVEGIDLNNTLSRVERSALSLHQKGFNIK